MNDYTEENMFITLKNATKKYGEGESLVYGFSGRFYRSFAKGIHCPFEFLLYGCFGVLQLLWFIVLIET